jgi:hypothetical protein
MNLPETVRLRELEEENAKLREVLVLCKAHLEYYIEATGIKHGGRSSTMLEMVKQVLGEKS